VVWLESAAEWRPLTLKERAGFQERAIVLCRMPGHETPTHVDSGVAQFTYQKGDSKWAGTDD
jgi:hypothetical protein